MTRESTIPFALFSAYLTSLDSVENERRTQFLAQQLTAAEVDWSNVTGAYKGSHEVSFLALLPNGDDSYAFRTVERLCRAYGQESLLYVDGQRQATLYYLDGRVEPIGVFHAVTEVDALERDGWTRDLAGTYYAVG